MFKIVIALIVAALGFPAKSSPSYDLELSDGLGSLGIMVHFLPGGADFKRRIGLFNVDKFVSDVSDMGVDYVMFPVGQNNGYYNAPNSVLIKKCPHLSGRMPDRDLLMELARGLAAKKIKFMIYLSFHAPKFDRSTKDCVGDLDEHVPTTREFIDVWSVVLGEWVERYSSLAVGVWVDGVYNTVGMSEKGIDGYSMWDVLCRQLKRGGINYIAFNPGTSATVAFSRVSPCQNITAGEQNNLPNLSQIELDAGLMLHIISFLGDSWGVKTSPRFEKYGLAWYLEEIKLSGGGLTLDVGVHDTGDVYLEHKYFITEINKIIK